MIGTSRLSGPSNVKGIDWAAAANSINGTAVTTPVPSTRIHSDVSAVCATLSARIEKAKSLAVGRRVLRDLDQLKVERRRAHNEANLKLKKEELERLKETKDSLLKVKLEQEALISKLTMMGEGRDPGALL